MIQAIFLEVRDMVQFFDAVLNHLHMGGSSSDVDLSEWVS